MGYCKGLFHLALYCNDMQASLGFYKKLGMEFLYDITPEGGKPWCIFLKVAHGQYLELQQVNSPYNPHPHPASTQYHVDQSIWHFALETEDLAGWIADMRSKGIRVWKDPDKSAEVFSVEDVFHSEDGLLVAWVLDPDGTPFEVQEQKPESLKLQLDKE